MSRPAVQSLLRWATPLCLLALAFNACSCEDTGINMVRNEDASVIRCRTDMDCGPRESCNATIGICFPKDRCGPDRPCENPAQTCVDFDGDGYTDCVFDPCETTDDCRNKGCEGDEIATCSARHCICGVPCQGGCPSSQGCCIPEDRCHDLPAQCRSLNCPAGQIISVTSTGAWDTGQCALIGETCTCTRLPPLPIGDIGLHSAVAHDGRVGVVSAYNLDYGDLMFGVVQSNGAVRWEFVDGVPTATTGVTGDVDGPRSGRSAPGADVGLYTDIAVDSRGRPHIVYQDRTHGDVKYALGLTTGWSVHSIAESGTAGLYSSITLDRAGLPRVAFLTAREGTVSRKSTLRLAITATSTPRSAADWVVRDIESLNLVPFGCEESCEVTEVCRASDLTCVIADPDGNCTPRCSADRRCISGRCSLIDPLPPFRDLPMARGLWPSVATLPDDSVLIAYYDRVDLSLKVARIRGPNPATGAISVVTVDGMGSATPGDVGLFASLFVTPTGEIHLAYMNESRRSVVYRSLDSDLRTIVAEEIETGIGMGTSVGGELVGADPSLVVDANGVVRVAYQNATRGELRYARRMGPGSWTIATLKGDEMPYRGSYGFYTDQTLSPDRRSPLVSTYRYFLSAPMGPDNGIEVLTPP